MRLKEKERKNKNVTLHLPKRQRYTGPASLYDRYARIGDGGKQGTQMEKMRRRKERRKL